MTNQDAPPSPSRVKIALAVAWVLAALVAGGWSVEQSTSARPEPAAAARPDLEAAVTDAAAGAVPNEESPTLTLAVVGLVAAAFAAVIGIRIWWSTVAASHPPPKLAPNPAHVSNARGAALRRGLLASARELVRH